MSYEWSKFSKPFLRSLLQFESHYSDYFFGKKVVGKCHQCAGCCLIDTTAINRTRCGRLLPSQSRPCAIPEPPVNNLAAMRRVYSKAALYWQVCFVYSTFRLKIVIYDLIFSHHFDVHAKFDPNHLAYTSHSLPLHSDNPYYDYVPGVGNLVNLIKLVAKSLLVKKRETCQKGCIG